jgi:hypothetical protein
MPKMEWDKATAREKGRAGQRMEFIPPTPSNKKKRPTWKLVKCNVFAKCEKCGKQIPVGSQMWKHITGTRRRHESCYKPRQKKVPT